MCECTHVWVALPKPDLFTQPLVPCCLIRPKQRLVLSESPLLSDGLHCERSWLISTRKKRILCQRMGLGSWVSQAYSYDSTVSFQSPDMGDELVCIWLFHILQPGSVSTVLNAHDNLSAEWGPDMWWSKTSHVGHLSSHAEVNARCTVELGRSDSAGSDFFSVVGPIYVTVVQKYQWPFYRKTALERLSTWVPGELSHKMLEMLL